MGNNYQKMINASIRPIKNMEIHEYSDILIDRIVENTNLVDLDFGNNFFTDFEMNCLLKRNNFTKLALNDNLLTNYGLWLIETNTFQLKMINLSNNLIFNLEDSKSFLKKTKIQKMNFENSLQEKVNSCINSKELHDIFDILCVNENVIKLKLTTIPNYCYCCNFKILNEIDLQLEKNRGKVI